MSGKANWLEGIIHFAVQQNLCTTIGCTTCGASEFRTRVLSAVARETGRESLARLDMEFSIAIGRALAAIELNAEDFNYGYFKFEAAVRFILCDIWGELGEEAAEHSIEPILAGSWAGALLARMKAHHAARMEEIRRREEEQHPDRVKERREMKRRLKQERHAERLAQKRERDLLRKGPNFKGHC